MAPAYRHLSRTISVIMDASFTLTRRAFIQQSVPTGPQKSSVAGLEPFVPTADHPWDERRVAHLLRRTGFGASLDQIDNFLNMTPAEAVDTLVDEALVAPIPEAPDWASIPPPPFDAPQEEKDIFYAGNQANRLAYRAAWIEEMRLKGLREKMALFWSDHFVTQVGGYGLASYTVQYLTTLRTYALGNFKTFTYDIGLLPAMLLYLNGQQNHKSGPNENYARELCELFTMGITDDNGDPNYTQAEITELARALTGWRVDRSNLTSYFEPNRFDTGEKTFFGRTGAFGYDEVIDIVFEERATAIASRICRKLYQYFVYDTPDEAVVAEMASVFLASDYEVAPVLRALFKSAHFFDDSVLGARIKNPMEYLLALINEVGIDVPEEDGYVTLFRYGNQLSQALFDPPNVAGWPGHHAWLSTGTLPLRWSYGANLINGAGVFEVLDPLPMAGKMSAPNDPYALARDIAEYVLPQPLGDEDYDVLAEVLLAGTPDYEWSLDAPNAPNRLRSYLAYLTQLPEFQLT